LWHVKEASLTLYWICEINPFSQATELIRFALYGQIEWLSAGVVTASLLIFMVLAIYGYDPGRGLIARRGGPE